LGLLVRTAGQVSLCQITFAAIGAAAFGHLAGSGGAGIPWLPALVLSGLVAVPIGAILAIPAIRLGGLYLALATFGFGILVQGMFYTSGLMFGASGLTEPLPDWHWLDLASPTGFYYLVLIITTFSALGVVWLIRSRLGRLLEALADSPVALATNGTSINVTRVLVFTISAFLASLAGALLGANVTLASGDLFNPITSLELIAVVLISVGGAPWYAIGAAAGLVLVPAYLTGGNVPYYLQIVFGVSAIGVGVAGLPAVNARLAALLDRAAADHPGPGIRDMEGESKFDDSSGSGLLEVKQLRVAFGGLVAVDDFSLSAPTGRITGLIGPNGAGKTTTFNACCGLVRPTQGGIALDGRDITRLPPAGRARLGLGRTFQQMELFDSLTVARNVALGREASQAGRNPLTQLVNASGEKKVARRAAHDALELCGIADLSAKLAGALSTGQRRLVELARCLAGPYRILLLDEPSSGLDRGETVHFGQILRRLVDERGVGILLVEHDMSLVMEVCEHIYVLDFGLPVFEGTPAEVASSPVVQAAYLGSSAELPEDKSYQASPL
jgi:ABC-type branched-subunit amino acid transport system ATPase component/ABC-type branched-subunit amino acid transport system permease subunit